MIFPAMWRDVKAPSIDLVTCIRAFYLLSASAILLTRAIPPLRDRFLDYGARQTRRDGGNTSIAAGSSDRKLSSTTSAFLDSLAQVKVSHARFSDFYSLSLLCLVFWSYQIFVGGAALQLLHEFVPETKHSSSQARVSLCLLLFATQSLRRLDECFSLTKSLKSSSSMWVGHYAIGLAFYFFTNIAIFVEHGPFVRDSRGFGSLVSEESLSISALDLLALTAFVVASLKQHKYHRYLYSLRKYTLPDEHSFRLVVAPHYTAECLIYVSLSLLSAPYGHNINRTMFCALIFVFVNLGVTADGTKRWMLSKFPDRQDDIRSRWRMIPMVF